MKSKWLFLAFVGVSLGLTCPDREQSSELFCVVTNPADLSVPGETIEVQSHEIGATGHSVTNRQTCRSRRVR